MKEEMKKEMEKLKIELTNNPNIIIKDKFQKCKNKTNEIKLNIPIFLQKEKLISVIFNSFDDNIHYSVICKSTDDFSKIESFLYEKYPEYKKHKKIFISNGNQLDVSRNLEENNIRNSDIITLKMQK